MALIRTSPSGPEVSTDPLEDLDPNSIAGNPTSIAAPAVSIPVPTNSVIGRAAGDIVTLSAAADFLVLGRVGGAIGFTSLSAGFFPAAVFPLSAIEPISANSVVANGAAGAASPTAFPVGANTVLGRVAGNLVAAQLVDAQITNATISLPKFATAAANTVLANATAGAASPTAFVVGTNTVLGRVAGNLVAAQLVNAQVVGGALATAKGVAFNGVAGTLTDLTGTQLGSFLRFTNTGDGVTAGAIPSYPLLSSTTVLTFNGVTNVLDGVAVPAVTGQLLIVQHIGAGTTTVPHESTASGAAAERFRLGNYAANTAVIVLGGTAPAQTAAFYYDGSRWVWITQAVGLASVINAALANMAANTVKVNPTAGAAAPSDLAVGANTVLGRVAGNIVAAQLVSGQIADANVPNAKLADMVQGTSKGRTRTGGTGVPTDLTQAQQLTNVVPAMASSIGYTAAAPLVLTLLAAGHQPGLYTVSLDAIVRAVATGGTLSRVYTYNSPTLGPTSTAAGANNNLLATGRAPVNSATTVFFESQLLSSDGSADIVMTITPAGITGAPVIDVYACATLSAL